MKIAIQNVEVIELGRDLFVGRKEIQECMRKLHNTARTYLDKNMQCGHISCQIMYWSRIKSTFVDDREAHEIQVGVDEASLLLKKVEWYKRENIEIPLAKKEKWCIPGYAKVLFKNKDTLQASKFINSIRVRPVIGASRKGMCSPLKPSLVAVCAIIFRCMKITRHYGLQIQSHHKVA